ncbi:MAG: APC family permease, partial [Gammaproteobacteria bacterium]|nr:APC family permease [Gammaproteobacteria bacterium]
MVNVAEEVNNPQRNMPRAILLAVIISTLLYAGVAIVAVLLVEPQQLATSSAPLADVYTAATGKPPVMVSMIGVFAVVNGALIQMIMASRLLYGMGSRQWLPAWFAKIHIATRTPLNSTVVIAFLILFFATLFPMVTLAEITSSLILIVFALINLALIKIKKKQPAPDGVRVFSVWVPRLGFATAILFLTLNVIRNISNMFA